MRHAYTYFPRPNWMLGLHAVCTYMYIYICGVCVYIYTYIYICKGLGETMENRMNKKMENLKGNCISNVIEAARHFANMQARPLGPSNHKPRSLSPELHAPEM